MKYKNLFYISIAVNIFFISIMQLQFLNSNKMYEEKNVYKTALFQKAQKEQKIVKIALYIKQYSRISEAYANQYAKYIIGAATEYKIDPMLLLVQYRTESNFRSKVTSSAGAIGIAQIMPYNYRKIPFINHVYELYDAKKSIYAGAYLLSKWSKELGDIRLAIRYYNGGFRGIYNPRWETRNYERKIFYRYNKINV